MNTSREPSKLGDEAIHGAEAGAPAAPIAKGKVRTRSQNWTEEEQKILMIACARQAASAGFQPKFEEIQITGRSTKAIQQRWRKSIKNAPVAASGSAQAAGGPKPTKRVQKRKKDDGDDEDDEVLGRLGVASKKAKTQEGDEDDEEEDEDAD